jgi:2-polyprenyl-6-hydroxyphenyl methylase/3-demethylubiquinone-9 3-methyltransferase
MGREDKKITMSQTNVDPLEIEKFQSLASRWWDKESEFKPLHDINPLRVDYIDNNCGGVKGKKILDIGCGGGILCEALAQRGAIVTGIDMAEMSLKVAKMHLYESELEIDYQFSTTFRDVCLARNRVDELGFCH